MNEPQRDRNVLGLIISSRVSNGRGRSTQWLQCWKKVRSKWEKKDKEVGRVSAG